MQVNKSGIGDLLPEGSRMDISKRALSFLVVIFSFLIFFLKHDLTILKPQEGKV